MFLQAAFNLTLYGWLVFPLQKGEKVPAIPKWAGGKGCLDATDDELILEQWDRKYPGANIGLACGIKSNLLVVDLDPRNGSDASMAQLKAKKQTFPPTVVARTASGGHHLYYAYEPSLINSKSKLAAGIDVKTEGGYVVAPPSVLKCGGRYLWEVSPLGGDLPRLPQWAVEALKPRPKPKPTGSYDAKDAPKDVAPLVKCVSNASEGNRNNILYWAARRAAETGILSSAAKAEFQSAGEAIGLDREEVEKTIASADENKKLANG